MINIIHNQALKAFNTFGIDQQAERFTTVHSLDDIREALSIDSTPTIIGGGSNFLLTAPINGLVIKNELKGITIVEQKEDSVLVAAQSGENWHDFVTWAVNNNLGGIENMALIPGTVGAAPIQNIGAYGVELKDVFHSLEAINIQSREVRIFTKDDCQFGYRDSIFKRAAKGQYIITTVYFLLQNTPHDLSLNYGAIQTKLTEKFIHSPTIRDVYNTVIDIRQSKLPDPSQIGNAGSFFKNPVISEADFQCILAAHPQVPHYKQASGRVKIPAAWLIDQCGWKGKQIGHAGCYKNQPLVLVNLGNATGQEILALSQQIQASVWERFQVQLETEVNIW